MPVIRISDDVAQRLKAINKVPGKALEKVLDVVEASPGLSLIDRVSALQPRSVELPQFVNAHANGFKEAIGAVLKEMGVDASEAL